MSAGESVSYEVYKLVRGRWSMRARYGDDERDAAFNEAYEQEKLSNVTACCIIKETYRVADNAAMESVVYHSPNLTDPPSVRAVTRELIAEPNQPDGPAPPLEEEPAPLPADDPVPPVAEEPSTDPPPPPRPLMLATPQAVQRTPRPVAETPDEVAEDEHEPNPEPSNVAPKPAFSEADAMLEFSIFEAVLRFFAVLFLSLLGGTLLGAVLFFLLKLAPDFGIAMTTDQARTVILSAGLLGAVAAFFPLLRFLLPDMTLSKGGSKAGMAAAAVGDVMMPGMQQPTPALVAAGAGAVAGVRRQPPAPPAPAPAAASDSDETVSGAAPTEEPGRRAEAARPAAPVPPTTATAPQPLPPAPGSAPTAPPAVRRNDPEDVAAVKEGLRSMADEAREVIEAQKGPLDPYRSFGVTLFLAGAGETLGRWHSVTQRRVAKAVAGIVEGLGAPAENAAGFAYHIDEYLLDPKFHHMYAAGRSSAVHRQYDDETPSGIVEAMEDWSRPPPAAGAGEPTAAENGLVSVMLTRVAAQAPGGGLAPAPAEFVHAHDEIVREMLGRYGGREIKHTGEGMLIAYSSAATAVEAASSMQQLFKRVDETPPEHSPVVSIVVAAGAPIQKTSDPRLTPVRIAAALMARADAHDILVAPPVPDLIKGEMFRFERSGTFQIAGVEEPLALFRVNW